MKASKIILITAIVTLVLAAPLYILPTYYLSICTYVPGDLVVTDPGKTSGTTHGKPPTTPISECGDLVIEGSVVKDNKFGVLCKNGCDSATRTFGLGIVEPPFRQVTLQLSYGPGYNIESREFRHDIGAMALYSWKYVSLGGGVDVILAKSKVHDIIPKIAGQIKFNVGK